MKKLSLAAASLLVGGLFAGQVLAADNNAQTAQPTETVEVVEVQTNAPGEPPLVRLANQLDLTADQRTSIKNAVTKARPELEKIADSLAKNGDALRKSMNNSTFDKKQVEKLAKTQGENVTKLILAQADLQHEILTVLNAKQKEQLQAIFSGNA